MFDASTEVGLEVNAERTKYMFMSYEQSTGQNHYVKLQVASQSFENVLTYRSCIHEKIKTTLNLGKHFLQNLLFSCLLSINI